MKDKKKDIKILPTLNRYESDYRVGLNDKQVQDHIVNGYINKAVTPPSKSVKQIITSNTFTYFNLIFTVLAVLIMLVGSYQNLLFMGIVIVNTFIGIIQEIRAKQTIDKLTVLSAPNAIAIRNGKEISLPTEKLVLDDVVQFSSGNQICADGIILNGEVEVNESLITGESDAIVKQEGETLLSGSFIVSGKCRVRLNKVGESSFASKLTVEAKRHKKVESEMMRALNKLIKVIGFIIIPFGITMFINQLNATGAGTEYAVVTTVASLTGMIPEGLYLLVSVALAVSVIRLAQQNTLVHELYCIETLARVDVLCLDKTGTITSGNMQVNNISILNANYDIKQISNIISAFNQYSDDDNATALALKNYFKDNTDFKFKRAVPFSSARKWSAVVFENASYIVGAPEFILHEQYEKYKQKIEKYSAEGSRVLLLAEYKDEISGDKLNSNVNAIALILLQDEIRKGAKETLEYFRQQDVNIKIISGDNPVTVSQIASRAGVNGCESYINSEELKTEQDMEEAVKKYTVFGRVTPDQKRMLVKALKKDGHTVAMTGDGVNDVLALKDADCSIAMASGSDAACQVAQLVLLDSNFSSMPKVVLEGRRVINNIERAASLFLVKTIYSSAFALLSIIFALIYPFMPIQLSLISALTVGVPSFFLAIEPNKARVKGKFLTNVFSKALPGGITNLINMVGISIICSSIGYSTGQMSTIATLVAGFTGMLILFQVCKPFDAKRVVLCLTMIIAFIGAILLMPNLFMLSALNTGSAMLTITFMLVTILVMKFLFMIEKKYFV